jgi:DNA-binding response OmpR family regulator
VLVVDDDTTLRDFIAMALSDQGYRTSAAGDGADALVISSAERPALVLMDIGMPGLGGRDLAARIQELCGPSVPCVVMSGSRPDDDVLHSECVAGYLAKPFGLDELFEVVHLFVAAPQPSPTQ